MKLTPEQKAAGWIAHDGSDVCPIKNYRTVHDVLVIGEGFYSAETNAAKWQWPMIDAYRIIEAHGADAEPARPTPFPASYDELVFDPITGWSQTVVVDGKRPEWLRDDDQTSAFADDGQSGTDANLREWKHNIAIRVRRREPKRETRRLAIQIGMGFLDIGTIDLIDGKPDLSTLKIAEEAAE